MPIWMVPLRVQQPLLHRAAEECAVGDRVAAEVAVPGIGMGVEVDQPDRAVPGDGAHDRERDQVIAAGRERHRAGRMHAGEEAFDAPDRVVQVDRIDAGIAAVGDPAKLVGADAEDVMGAPHQARHVANLARAVAGAGTVGGAVVPGHTHQRNIHGREIGDVGQPHEGRYPAEARHVHAADRLVEALAHGWRSLPYSAAMSWRRNPKISISAALMPST